MMGQQRRTASLFYYFRLEEQIPTDHLLRMIDGHVALDRSQFTKRRGDNALSSEGFYKLPISFGVHSVNVDRQTTTDLQFVGTGGAVEGVHHGPLCFSPFCQHG